MGTLTINSHGISFFSCIPQVSRFSLYVCAVHHTFALYSYSSLLLKGDISDDTSKKEKKKQNKNSNCDGIYNPICGKKESFTAHSTLR